MKFTGIIIGIIFIVTGAILFPWDSQSILIESKYVGGDAYNFIITSNLLAGRMIYSAIVECTGWILFIFSGIEYSKSSGNQINTNNKSEKNI
jgi:hypothetical protein